MNDESGWLSFDGEHVSYELNGKVAWRVPAAAVRTIGEYTNQSGPALDDYFFVFLLKNDDHLYAASFYAKGRDTALLKLREKFPGLGPCALANSTDFNSRTLWPPDLVGQKFLKFEPIKRGAGMLNRVLDACVPPFVVECTLLPEFRAEDNA